MSSSGSRCRRKILFSYDRHESLLDIFCFYCGCIGDSVDHIPPVSFAYNFSQKNRIAVRACRACNIMLSNRPLYSFLSRIEFLLNRHLKKYKSILKTPDWSNDEIEELNGNLKRKIKAHSEFKTIINDKIKYLKQKQDYYMQIIE